MKGLKGKEHNILVALNDSACSIMSMDSEYIQKSDIEQLKAVKGVLMANKDLLSSYYVDLVTKIYEFLIEYYNNRI